METLKSKPPGQGNSVLLASSLLLIAPCRTSAQVGLNYPLCASVPNIDVCDAKTVAQKLPRLLRHLHSRGRALLGSRRSHHGLNALNVNLTPSLSTPAMVANPPPFSSTMTVWQRASSRRNSLSTGSLSRRAASSSLVSQKSIFCCPWWLQVSADPCRRHGQAAGTLEEPEHGALQPGMVLLLLPGRQ